MTKEYLQEGIEQSYKLGFSASDITAIIPADESYGIKTSIPLGTLSMLSISTHRDKFPVSTLSRVGPRGFTYGHRTIGGTMAFSTLDRQALAKVFDASVELKSSRLSKLQVDELPLFNIVITAVNEFGLASYSTLEGVTILDEGLNYSLDNVVLMESYSYMALKRIPFQSIMDEYHKPEQLDKTILSPSETIASVWNPSTGTHEDLFETSRKTEEEKKRGVGIFQIPF